MNWLPEFNHLMWEIGTRFYPEDVNREIVTMFGNSSVTHPVLGLIPKCSVADDYITPLTLEPKERYIARVRKWIQNFTNSYGNIVELYSILNESVSTRCGPSLLGSHAKYLKEVIVDEIRKLDPDAILYLNDYDLIEYTTPVTYFGKTSPQGSVGGSRQASFLKIIDQVNALDPLLYDAIGVQGHFHERIFDLGKISAAIETLSLRARRPILITEFDQLDMNKCKFPDPGFDTSHCQEWGHPSREELTEQQEIDMTQNVSSFLKMVLEMPQVKGVNLLVWENPHGNLGPEFLREMAISFACAKEVNEYFKYLSSTMT